jgi:hypothetical protein
MKIKGIVVFFSLLVAIFVTSCEVTSNAKDDGSDNNSQEVCGNGSCGNGETHQNCPADCPENPKPVCGNSNCETGENSENCPEDCAGCTDANANGVCDNAEYIGIYCYSQRELDSTIYGDTTYLGQFSYPTDTLEGWATQNDVTGFIESGDTVCYTLPKPLPMVEHGYEILYCAVTAGIRELNYWVAQEVAPKTIGVLVGNTITPRPVLPIIADRGYIACLNEEAPLCWENLCTLDKNGAKTCYDGAVVDNTCGVSKNCQTCVEHCKDIANIIGVISP